MAALNRLMIGNAMKRLCPQHRAVIRRAYYLGWTTERTAADLKITEAMVTSRLHDALHSLRLILQEMTQ